MLLIIINYTYNYYNVIKQLNILFRIFIKKILHIKICKKNLNEFTI